MRGTPTGRVGAGAKGLVFTAFAAACAVAAVAAFGATESKPYHATINGAISISVPAGSTFTAAIAIVNDSDHPLGSANVVVPSAFDVGPLVPDVAEPAGKTWLDAIESPENTIQLRNPGPSHTNALSTGESVTVTTPVRAPCPSTSPQVLALDTQAKQSNDFNGVGNDLFLADADEPRISVEGYCQLAVSIVVPDGGDPAQGEAFTVDVDLLDGAGNPMTLAADLLVEVCEAGAGTFGGSVTPTAAGCFSATIPAGASEVLVVGVTYSPAENNVTVTASTTAAGIQPGSTVFSVVTAKGKIDPGQTSGSTCIDGDAGPFEVCLSVILPDATGTTIRLATRPCTGLVGTCTADELGEAIGDFGFLTAPAKMVLEYDRLLRVSTRTTVFFDPLKPGSVPEPLVKCLKGGHIPAGEDGCLLKAGKNPAGDTVFEILFFVDPRLFGR